VTKNLCHPEHSRWVTNTHKFHNLNRQASTGLSLTLNLKQFLTLSKPALSLIEGSKRDILIYPQTSTR